MGITQRAVKHSRSHLIQANFKVFKISKIKFNMSISDWSNYEGKSSDVKWSKDDLLEHLAETENVSETSSKGITFMHVATMKGWQDVIAKLDEVDPAMKDAQSDIGTTPAMNAAFYKKTGIVKYLLDQG